jgi:hypothetical protein
MRSFVSKKVATIGGSVCLLLSAVQAGAGIVNPMWDLPNSASTPPNNATGTDSSMFAGAGNVLVVTDPTRSLRL